MFGKIWTLYEELKMFSSQVCFFFKNWFKDLGWSRAGQLDPVTMVSIRNWWRWMRLPSGKHTKKYGKSSSLLGKFSCKYTIFYVAMLAYQRVAPTRKPPFAVRSSGQQPVSPSDLANLLDSCRGKQSATQMGKQRCLQRLGQIVITYSFAISYKLYWM